ncbi:MAG: 4-(cytidine 5'-diphospho)-2-C-methyl-D-erythritol kinase [Planctomycetota bacterium]
MPDNPASKIVINCPAKLNLTLAVGPASNDGMHPIASIMAPLSFADTLKLSRSEAGSTFLRAFDPHAPRIQPIDWAIEQDLVFQAHRLVERELGRRLPVRAELTKRIPAGAGLGGGSSNAAGMLIGLRELFGFKLEDNRLVDLGARLGADVAFSIHAALGCSAALVTGIGELVEPTCELPFFHCVLVFPDGDCPTGQVYQHYDRLGKAEPILDSIRSAWRQVRLIPPARNDLTEAAIEVCPQIGGVFNAIKSQHFEPRLTGSGSCVFAITASQHEGVAIAETFKQMGLTAVPTHRFSGSSLA